ncbi:nucleoid-associated protein [Sediminitomix flava]|uniref:Nucleoid associated protein NdpA n=1 Tax=Sediminitomix flava TaxID=379075 RepID=A0A315ZD70_SEDFL|nr:nucleoid-associated protein [Sediminitomix flava]PWJ42798.1 nucleoid associated protein NdpA [Sediminitomix flava]
MTKALDFGSVKLKHLALHKVGNKIQEEDLELSDFELEVEENSPLHKSLMAYFLKPFREGGYYHFTDESEDLNLNEMFGFSRRLFNDPFEQFMPQSREIAKHLYNTSTHPNIKGGEFYVAYLEDCIVDGEVVNAIGLFKTENKEKFLKVKDQKTGAWAIVQDEGANVKKLDKGCLIFNFEEEKGFKICLKDSPSKNVEAQYWKESFLRLKKREDSFFHTQNYLNICKEFVEDVFNEEHNVERPQQMDMLNRSMKFFTENEDFNIVEFENSVMEEPEVIDAFQEYKDQYKEKNEVPVFDEFKISSTAVKKSRKDFKSVIKLDKKIQINVAGNEEHIEKGFDDEKGMSYYIVYYNEEE